MLTPRALLVPTLPTLLVDEHRHHRTEMLVALEALAGRLHVDDPEIVVALSARWGSEGPFLVDAGKRHRTLTDYPGFGVEVRYDCPGHPELARALVIAGVAAGARVAEVKRGVDSGVTVPLHFLLPSSRIPVVPLSLADRSAAECRAWGATLRSVLSARPERITFVVGGMLSYHQHAWSLGRDLPEARVFDERLLDALRTGAWDAVRSSSPAEAERVQPQAGLRHLELLRGFLGSDPPGVVLCYESSPGVGSALVEFEVTVEAMGPVES
jgi:aromatic ring-opening dioxygenase catalytic subunit (LigB family)